MLSSGVYPQRRSLSFYFKYRDKLYNELKKTKNTERYHITKTNLRTYNKILKRKVNHFHSRFNNCKDNIKHTWSIIKEIMSRGEKASFPESFNANGKSIKDNQTIADEFNIYFLNIGKKLTNDIQDNNVTFDQFLNTPSENISLSNPSLMT